MADSIHQKKLYLDYSNHLELCMLATPDQPPTLTERQVGTGLCALINIGVPRLQKLRAHLNQMMPMTAQDADAYAIMISIKLGNVPLPDSEFAAKLFSLLETIAELDDVFYLAMQMDTLLNQFEQGAPEKTIVKHLAATAARAAAALDTAMAELPLYKKRIDAIFNYTEIDKSGATEPTPLLSRALAYQRESSDLVLQFRNALSYRLFSRSDTALTEIFSETAEADIAGGLFYGDLLARLPVSDLMRLMFQQMLLSDTVVRVCGVCGRYFVPTVRSNEKYCDFVSPDVDGTPLTCKQRSTKNRLETDTSLKLLKGAYDKNFIKSGRKKDPDYRAQVFRPWYQWAKQQRALYLDGEIDLEELTERLHRNMDCYLETSAAAAGERIPRDEQAPQAVEAAQAQQTQDAAAESDAAERMQEIQGAAEALTEPERVEQARDAAAESDAAERLQEIQDAAEALTEPERVEQAQDAAAESDAAERMQEIQGAAEALTEPERVEQARDAAAESDAAERMQEIQDAAEALTEPERVEQARDAAVESDVAERMQEIQDAAEALTEPERVEQARDAAVESDAAELDEQADDFEDQFAAQDEEPIEPAVVEETDEPQLTVQAAIDAEADEADEADEQADLSVFDNEEDLEEPDESDALDDAADKSTFDSGDKDDQEDAFVESYLEEPEESEEPQAPRSRWKFPWFGQ